METNGMPGGIISGMPSAMLGLELPMHQQHHQPPNPHHHPQHILPFATDHHSQARQQQQQQQQYQNPYAYSVKSKQHQQQNTPVSDEDDASGFAEETGAGDGSGSAGKRTSPWQRMKWTDSMVKRLIMVVYYVGDDAVADGNDKKKGPTGAGGGLLQKKGKWKSVSRVMMEKGFSVSPQQCEDKFNDLNKRYKRVNDILGKGTACKVVENQSLLETMDNLSPKMKEEVRKLLNSKHLFFREMCAYHSSCSGGTAGAHQVETSAVDSSHHLMQQKCLHSSQRKSREEEEEEGEDEDEEDEEDDEEDEFDDENEDGNTESLHGEEGEKGVKRQRRRMVTPSTSPMQHQMQQLSCEVMSVLRDRSRSVLEQREWLRSKVVQLEEQKVGYQCQAFELEKQRFKWVKFSGKKEREMERLKLDNEKMRLENERMVLLLRQKELELDLNYPHQQFNNSNKRPDHTSPVTG